MKRVILKKFLICMLIIIMSCNFLFSNINFVYAASGDDQISMGDAGSNIVTGLIGLLLYPITIIPTATFIGIGSALQGLLKVNLGQAGSSSSSVTSKDFMTPFDILFNEVPIVNINFFDITGSTGTVNTFRRAVASWYYTMRLLACMILLVILIYVGIRMALSSIASEKAMYKKMLIDWTTSLALLFLLHYIMMFVFVCNDALVNALKKVAEQNPISFDNMMGSLKGMCFHYDIVVRTAALIIYGMMLFQTISFLIAYMKRMLTIGFLIMIAPLITITYSVDKIGDGKAQALNTWLKEFILNILLQPFQCILYLAFVDTSLRILLGDNGNGSFSVLSANNVGKAVFAIMCMHFVKEGEKLIKKIFGFNNASTAGDLAAGAAITTAAMFKGRDVASKAGGAIGKAKNTIKYSKAGQTMIKAKNDAKNQIKVAGNIAGKKAGDQIKKAGNAVSNSKPIKRSKKSCK